MNDKCLNVTQSLFKDGFIIRVALPNSLQVIYDINIGDIFCESGRITFYESPLILCKEVDYFVSFLNKDYPCHEVEIVFKKERPLYSLVSNKELRYIKRKKSYKIAPEAFLVKKIKTLYVRLVSEKERFFLTERLLSFGLKQKAFSET